MVYQRKLEIEFSMKATELMIGDWVLVKNKPVQVVGITTDSIETTDKEGYCYEDYFKPITLTAEILEKNGFKRFVDDEGQELYDLQIGEWEITYMSIFGCPYMTIEDILDYDSAHSVMNLKDSIYHVHELQHELRKIGYEIHNIN